MEFTTDRDILANTLLYVINRVRNPDRHRVAKVLYLADKCHLERYGLPITGDRYIKMHHGPMPSLTSDTLRALGGEHHPNTPEVSELAARLEGALYVEGQTLQAGQTADPNELSDSMIECLDDVISDYDTLYVNGATDLSHDAAWESTALHQIIPVERIVATLKDSELLLDYLRDPHGLNTSEQESATKAV
ncbi:MAG: Panacea domain-containing protein [Trueperaceae bacterium]|nr:Panacea domain-containing protein [Trueperaceae bacterium]